MKKILYFSILILLTFGFIYFVSKQQIQSPESNRQIKVVASFYPYYYFASQIGGSKITTVNITPSGAEPHDYEPTPLDILNIKSSQLLILNGKIEPWINKINVDLQDAKTQILILENAADKTSDPHTWLNFHQAQIQSREILKKLIAIDPQNQDYYTKNAQSLTDRLNSLDEQFHSGLINCELKNVITSHTAFAPLLSEYGITQVPIAGLSPDSEPSLKQMAQIANFVKENNIKYIFFESLVSPKLAQTIASETHARTLVLNPLEGLTPDQINSGKDYIIIMRENLTNLRIALQCQ